MVTEKRICSVEGCDRVHYASGMCNLHWQRQRKGQQIDAPLRGSIRECSIEGCTESGRIIRGLCQKHYKRWWQRKHENRNIDLAIKLPGGRPVGLYAGPNHPGWLGDEIAYKSAHSRVQRTRGSASKYLCAYCGKQAHDWAYNHTDPNPKVGESNGCWLEYSLDVNCYVPLCVPCHRAEDARYRKAR